MTVSVTCEGPGCTVPLDGRRDRRYCSAACRQAAHRARHGGRAVERAPLGPIPRGQDHRNRSAAQFLADTVTTIENLISASGDLYGTVGAADVEPPERVALAARLHTAADRLHRQAAALADLSGDRR